MTKPSAQENAASQVVISVRFESPDGDSWTAVGGGDTLDEAILFARESCPEGPSWEPIDWSELFGE